jgi:hypothetical protein
MMPALVLIRIPERRWLPPVPIPVFLLWPFVPVCVGLAGLLGRGRPAEAETVRAVVEVFWNMRGLTIDVDTADDEHVHIRFV